MNKIIYFSVILTVLTCFSCKQDFNNAPKVDIGLETKLDSLRPAEISTIMSPTEKDSTAKGESKKPIPVNSSPKEKRADEELTKKAIEDIQKSKYKSCQDVLTDYESCIVELKKGNTTPMMNFPSDTDPFCKVCYEGADFKVKMDSLKRIAKKVHKEMLN